MSQSAFETVIRLQLDKFGPEAARRKHIEIARKGLNQFLSGQAMRPDVLIETDGHSSASEDEVKPFGVITYRFFRMKEVVLFALAEARRISPVETGKYRDAWFPIMNGTEVAIEAISNNAGIIVTNDEPFARKVHVGARGFEKYAGIVEKVRQQVLRKYGKIITADIQFVTLEGGWVLQKGLRKIHRGRRYGAIRNDAAEGMEITYPALFVEPKFR